MVLIKCRQLTLGYGSKDIVSDFDYDINAGEYLCIVGRNGSGKTTLLRGISGLLSPKSGSIELCDGLTRNQIGYLPQIGPLAAQAVKYTGKGRKRVFGRSGAYA